MPDARVQAAIDNWGSRLIDERRRLQRLPAASRRARALGRLARRVVETGRRAPQHAERSRDAGLAPSPPGRRSCARPSATTSRSSSGSSTPSATAPTTAAGDRRAGRRRTRCSTRRPSGSRRRSTAARLGGEPAPAAPASERPPLVVLIPGLDSTKEEFFHWEDVFLRRGMATLSMDGPGQGESGFELDIRPDYEVRGRPRCSTRLGRARATSTSIASARRASAWAATTRRGRRRSSRGSAPWPASAGRTT